MGSSWRTQESKRDWLWSHGGSLCGVGAARGGREEPVAASPEPATAAEVTPGGGAVDQRSGPGVRGGVNGLLKAERGAPGPRVKRSLR